jgi:hypothetical protein
MYRSLLLFLLLPALALGQLIDDDVLPFGGYSSHPGTTSVFYSSSKLQVMHDSLGMNQFTSGGFYGTTTQQFASQGIYVYPWGVGLGEIEPQIQFAGATYFICEPESASFYNIRFKDWNLDSEPDPTDSFVVYSGDSMMLDNLRFYLANRYDWLEPNEPLSYYPSFRMKIDTSDPGADTTVGVFRAIRYYEGTETRFEDTLYFSDLPGDTARVLDLVDENSSSPFFYTRDEEDSTYGGWMRFQFETFGNCVVYIDYFRLHCQYGKLLVEDHQFDDQIKESVGREAFKDKILGWMLKDVEEPGNFRTFAYIDYLIQDTTAVWDNPVRGYAEVIPGRGSGGGWGDSFRDYMRIIQPEMGNSFLYPIWAGSKYTGFEGEGLPGVSTEDGLQYDIRWDLVIPCDSIRVALNQSPSTDSWMYWPQYWWCLQAEGCTSWEQRRKPTRSELQCITYIGMCYHPKSIMFWKYDSTPYSNPDYATQGLVDADGNPRPELYGVVKNDINPYIKAIDATYMSLEWQRAYPYHNGTPDFTGLPTGAYVSSISSFIHPDSVSLSPDSGWFHVGEYTDTLGAKYMMLVNRSCNFDSVTLAPSVTATVKFDASQLGWNYLYIIDIADSVEYVDYDSVAFWADTTYSAEMSDGTIPFTTVLGPGEGRLFKIVQASKRDLTYHDDELSSLQGR